VLWQRSLRAPLSAGPAAADGLLVVGSSKGDVIAWSQEDGVPRWRVRINAEILSAAAIGDGLVVVRGVDGKLHGLSAKDGSENWVVDQQVPRLSLRGTSRPLLVGDLAVCGFDNGRVVAVSLGNGSTAWETAVGQSHGSTELQRLIDVDASVVADGDDLFAVAYQGRVARLSRENGQIVWARDLSSFRGLAVDANAVYVSTAEGDVVRLDRRTGTEQWRQKALERRQLSAPAVYGGRIVIADLAGSVHWLDAATGDLIARTSVGKQRISSPLVVAGDLLLVFGDGGELNALRAAALVPK
jgi:outer membrane protein assembly factor BamB